MKITVNKWVLTQSKLDRLLENKSTINLSWRFSTQQHFDMRNRRIKRYQKKILKKYTFALLLFAWVVSILFWVSKPADTFWNAHSSNFWWMSEYEYYGVDNFADYTRKLRLETCERTWVSILWEISEEQLLHCWTILTLITAYESDYMNSPRCVNDNNCMWIKWTQPNWAYGFLKFENQYKWYLYFGEKFWNFHYKKSIHTLIYWYLQENWTYKYGWSGDSLEIKQRYVDFVSSKYDLVYNQLKDL